MGRPKFKSGLKPAGENGTYFRSAISGARSAYVWPPASEPRHQRPHVLQPEGNFAVDTASTAPAKIDARRVRRLRSLGAAKARRVHRRDVKGKIVLALKGSPTTAPTPRVQFAPAPAPKRLVRLAPRTSGRKKRPTRPKS